MTGEGGGGGAGLLAEAGLRCVRCWTPPSGRIAATGRAQSSTPTRASTGTPTRRPSCRCTPECVAHCCVVGAGACSAAQRSTGTAQHSTAQAQHSTAQHSTGTAQHSTAQGGLQCSGSGPASGRCAFAGVVRQQCEPAFESRISLVELGLKCLW